MSYKSIIGAVSGGSSIVKYSDEERAWQVYTRWKNGKPRFALRRVPDIIAYEAVTEYTTFVQTDSKMHGGFGLALVGDMLFGPIGAIGGAVLGRKQSETIKQLGFAFRTKAGDEYVIPVLYSPRGTRSDKAEAKNALRTLQKVVDVFTRIGTEFTEDWHTDIDAWR
jgi:hypothetical protein